MIADCRHFRVAQAKTGTGKTLAFLVPVFQRVLMDQPELADRTSMRRASSQDIRAIILSPTRELAEQIGEEARRLAKNTRIIVQTAVGGTRKRESLFRMWREGCDILVATPGRLNDLLSDPDAKVAAPKLQAFVLDEADRMLDVGFADEIRDIQSYLPSTQEVERQTLLFSATIPRNVVHLAKSMVRPHDFEFVQTIKEDDVPTHERVPQQLVTVQGLENIFPVILEIAHKAAAAQDAELPFKAIVFFSNTASVEFANRVLQGTETFARHGGIRTFEIHSKLTQAMRTRSADHFRRAKSAILFSSDVTARGMDFPGVTDVIQVGLPPNREQYIHRVGRTGRAGNSGKGWLILAKEEVNEARQRLPGLPIKPNKTIEAADHVVGETPASELVSQFFKEVDEKYPSLPKYHFRSVYMGSLGQNFGRVLSAADYIGLLNRWCKHMGWPEPPAVSPKVAQNRGLTNVPGVRIGHDHDDDPSDRAPSDRRSGFGSGSGSFGSRSGSFGSRSGSFGSGSNSNFNRRQDSGGRGFPSRDNRDPFEARFESRTDNRSGDRFGGRSGDRSGGRSDNRFGGRSENRFGGRSENRFGGRSGGGRSGFAPRANF